MEFIDFIFVNCCLILNIKSVKKKHFLQLEIFKCTLSKVEVLHNLYRHYTKIKGADNRESNHDKYRTRGFPTRTRREHSKDTSEGVTYLRSLRVLQLPKVAMLLLLRKKTREKAGNAQNILPVSALPVMTLSEKALGRILRNFRLRTNILPIPVTDVTSLPLGRGRRREHPKNTSRDHMTFGHYGCCATSVCACAHPMEPRRGSSDIRSHLVAMLLLLRKKCGEKSGMRRTYFRSGPLLDMATSGQCLFRSRDFVTSGHKADTAQFPVVHAQNTLPD